jgi:hypothetical protein
MTDQNQTPDAQPAAEQNFEVGDLRDVFVDSVESIELGEDGSLDMVIADPDEGEHEYVYVDEAGQPIQDEGPSAPTQDTPAEPAHDWEKRYGDLQPQFTKVTQENAELRERLARIEGQLQGDTSGKTDTKEPWDPWTDEAQPSSGLTEDKVVDVVKAVLDEAMSLYVPQDMVKQWNANAEVSKAQNDHDDFTEMVPHIEAVYERFPDADMSVEQAYQLAKFAVESVAATKVSQGPQAPPADTPEAPQSEPVLTREELIERSQRLQTAQGHSFDGPLDHEEVVKTPRDAIRAALRDMEDSY